MILKLILIILISFVFGFWFGPRAGMLWLFFLLFLVYAWDSRIVGTVAVISLVSCPFLLVFHKDSASEVMAQYAYFFLVMTVILQIAEYKRSTPEGGYSINEKE